MDAPAHTAAGTTVSLEQMLAAREQRAARQAAALARFDKPLVSMTVVIPGPVKDGWLPRRVLAEALQELEAVSSARHWPILAREVWWQETGPEALYVMDVDAQLVKSATVELEDQHPLGRLWDLDVIAPGPRRLSRQELGSPARRCLVCERPAHACGRSRRHPLQELLHTIGKIVDDYDLRLPA
jgi:holo-ACP synthase